jgi:ribosomal protein S24E
LSTLEITSDTENPLLQRRELSGVFRGGSGLLTRQGAREGVASKIGVQADSVQIISLEGSFGTRDLAARAYVFSDKAAGKKQLASFRFTRILSKEDRAKAREEKKKAKSAGPKPAPAPKAAEAPKESEAPKEK